MESFLFFVKKKLVLHVFHHSNSSVSAKSGCLAARSDKLDSCSARGRSHDRKLVETHSVQNVSAFWSFF